jgi:hypothetical protein
VALTVDGGLRVQSLLEHAARKHAAQHASDGGTGQVVGFVPATRLWHAVLVLGDAVAAFTIMHVCCVTAPLGAPRPLMNCG